jgi:hypothetical protein
MSKGEKRIWVPLLPSMPKGEIVIDGKYNNEDGMNTGRM